MHVGVLRLHRVAPSRRSPRAASARRRRCRGTPASCRAPSATGSGNRRGCARRRSTAGCGRDRSCCLPLPPRIDHRLPSPRASARARSDRAPRSGTRAPAWRAPPPPGCRGCGDRTAGRRRARRRSRRGCISRRRRRSRAAACCRSRLGRQQQRLVHLVAVGLLRDARHLDLALEHAARMAGQHVLHGLARRAGRRVVRDDGGEIARAGCRRAAAPRSDAPPRRRRRAAHGLPCAPAGRRASARSCRRCARAATSA